jgi:hypothetical protein
LSRSGSSSSEANATTPSTAPAWYHRKEPGSVAWEAGAEKAERAGEAEEAEKAGKAGKAEKAEVVSRVICPSRGVAGTNATVRTSSPIGELRVMVAI